MKIEQKLKKNLVEMIAQLDGVEATVADLEQLALQIVLEAPDPKEKVAALRLLVDIRKSLGKKGDEGENLLDVLREESTTTVTTTTTAKKI